ncbi:hypothetical protein PROFUN_11894 [Planoprotostelium fungivorum]|uniref:Uncharacterized protein n=1 Tax=Planoprotostelium fungivorum TaxID=1890364 RepID=A0A2P6N921_9EUKA|nr:hypothetical protein PROFUN_11894 [Planoprotostelium fungivorum]
MSHGTSPFGRYKVGYRVSLPLHCQEQEHIFGINSVALSSQGNTLFSAGRDATVKQWKIRWEKEGDDWISPVTTYSQHTNWVNDVVVIGKLEDRVMSCSSDCTIKIWKIEQSQEDSSHSSVLSCSESLNHYHADYVKCLSYSSGAERAFSAGLDSNIYLWDVSTGAKVIQHVTFPKDKKKSIYCIDSSEDGNTMICGSADGILSVWDVRQPTQQKKSKLRGHVGNIRRCVLSSDGIRSLSAGADGSVKLWDLRQQRCIRTYDDHSESVWTLALPDKNLSGTFYSSGRDMSILRTDIASGESVVIAKASSPIQSLLFHRDHLLVASANAGQIKRISLDSEEREEKMQFSSRIIEGHLLNDKMHVLTKNEGGVMDLYNIIDCKWMKRFEEGDLNEQLQALNTEIYVPNWCSIEVDLTIVLDQSYCFSAECYASDIDPSLSTTKKVNLGQLMLSKLFGTKRDPTNDAKDLTNDAKDLLVDDSLADDSESQNPEDYEESTKMDEPSTVRGNNIQITLMDAKHGSCVFQWERPVRSTTPNEDACVDLSDSVVDPIIPPSHLPHWIHEAVSNKLPSVKSMTIPFSLISSNEKAIQQLSSKESKLTSPRLFRITKIIAHIITKLELQPITVKGTVVEPQDYVQIICQNKVVDKEMTMGTVKAFVWRSSEELVLKYGIDPRFEK